MPQFRFSVCLLQLYFILFILYCKTACKRRLYNASTQHFCLSNINATIWLGLVPNKPINRHRNTLIFSDKFNFKLISSILQNQNSLSSKMQSSLSNYEQISQIGKGSFGVVKKVRRLIDNKTLVWKQMNYSNMSSREKQQLVTQVNVLKQLCHSNIVKYYDRIVDHKQRKVYILMEYCSGGDLASYIKLLKSKGQCLPEDVIWKFFYQVIMALDECHKKKIMHRDIKPANILIDESENGDSKLKLGDFGLSRELGEHSQFAQTSVGTPYYMSPEQVSELRYNQKSDIWSAGCIFYELASLRRPFEATNHLALSQKICNGKFDRIPGRYSEDLQKVIEAMLIVDPEKRPTTETILKLPYLSIREEEKKIKSILNELRTKQEELLATRNKLLQQIKEVSKGIQVQNPFKLIANQKDNKAKMSQNLISRERQKNKENLVNFGNFTDRY